jgi:hypothetical protein
MVADFVAEGPVVLLGDALGGCAGRDAPGLEHDQVRMIGAKNVSAQERRRNARGFPRPGLCHQNQRVTFSYAFNDVRKMIVNRQGLGHEGQRAKSKPADPSP